MTAESTRPLIHFAPASGWMNDPLGLTWHNGVYHLFFQYVPGRTSWAPECRWGHATSEDLTHWREHAPALEPGDGDDGIWSGSLVVDPIAGPTIFYTSVSVPEFGIGRIRTARPDDADWLTWTKQEVVVDAPRDDLIAFRDPFVFRDGDSWRMFVGTATEDGTAAASSFSSADLQTWRSDGFAASRASSETDPVWTGALWECPQLFELDGRHILVTSVWDADELHYVAYGVGSYNDGRFIADSWHRLTYGDGYYAPSLFRDSDGRPGLIFWIRGVLDEADNRASALSLPMLVELAGDELRLRPHPQTVTPTAHRDELTAPLQLTPDSAWQITWTPGDGDALSIGEDRSGLTLTLDGDRVHATLGDRSLTIERSTDEITVIVDRQVVEILAGSAGSFGSAAVLEGPLRGSGSIHARALTTATIDAARAA